MTFGQFEYFNCRQSKDCFKIKFVRERFITILFKEYLCRVPTQAYTGTLNRKEPFKLLPATGKILKIKSSKTNFPMRLMESVSFTEYPTFVGRLFLSC